MKDTNLIIGKINSGKTRGILLKEMDKSIKNKDNLLILDNKLEYYGTYYKKLKENGYNILVLNLDDTTKSNGFNPLYLPYQYYKKGNVDNSLNLINSLAHQIFITENPNSDPFWENTASDYFTGLTQILFEEGKIDQINLGSIGILTNDSDASKDALIKKYMDNLNPLDSIYMLTSPTIYAPSETRGSILSVLKQKMNLFLMRPNLLNLLNTSDIKLDEIKDKTAIFIISNEKYNVFANVFIEQLSNVVIKNKMKFTYILDNFDTLPHLEKLKDLVENATYYNLKLYVATRNTEELENKNGKYIIDKFQNIINLENEELELTNVLNDGELPNLEQSKHEYFSLKDIF